MSPRKKSTFIRLFPNLTGAPAYRAPEQCVPPPNQNARSNHHALPDRWPFPHRLASAHSTGWTPRWWTAVAHNPDLVAAGRRFFLVALLSVNAFPKIGLYTAMASL